MDMKKIPKPRMEDYDYERKQRREREKSERQQVQTAANREVLFPEPRRVQPSEADDDIVRKLGDFSKVKDFIKLHTVGIWNAGHRQIPPNAVLTGIVPPGSALSGGGGAGLTSGTMGTSSSSSTSTQRLPAPPPPTSQHQQQQSSSHHYQTHQQQQQQQQQQHQQHQQQQQQPSSRQSASSNYVKQPDNKPPFNGRVGYTNQPQSRSGSGGMAPPKGPAPVPAGSLLPPPTMTHMPNGRQLSSSSSSSTEKSYLGPLPPALSSTSTTTTHNGRFPQPSIPKIRQKHLPPENDIINILTLVTDTFCPPKMLTGIDATPHTTIIENYNLNEPNKHKYSFDISRTTSTVDPLDSPPRSAADMPAPNFVPPSSSSSSMSNITNNSNNHSNNPNTSQLPSSASASSSLSSSTYIAPATLNSSTSAKIGQHNHHHHQHQHHHHHHQQQQQQQKHSSSSSLVATTTKTAPHLSPLVPLSPILSSSRTSTDTLLNRKSMKIENQLGSGAQSDKHNESTLENDLELSDSEDERKKQNCTVPNTSDSSGTDSSESGSEESSKSESHQVEPLTIHSQTHQHQPQQQHQVVAALTSKKKLSNYTAAGSLLTGGGSSGGHSSSSSGLGSSIGSSNATPCSSSSSSNKTPSPSNTTKWQLSRYFNKAPVHQTPTEDVVSPTTTAATVVNSVNSMNVVNLNMPTMLPGGAQIIPEPPQQLTNIKNERLLDDQGNPGVDEDDDDNNDDDDEDDSEDVRRVVKNTKKARRKADQLSVTSSKNDTSYPHHANLAAAAAASFPTRKPPAGLSVTALSPLLSDIKKEAADVRSVTSGGGLVNNSVQVPVLNASEFVAIPSNQIKHETLAIAGGHTTVTHYTNESSSLKRRSNDYGIEGLSGLSSDTDSCIEDTRERLPVPGPGGTLQIPGVPAAITALPRSPNVIQKQQHQQPNTLTVTPIDPLPTKTKQSKLQQQQQQRTKKPRKKVKQSQPIITADTSDEEDPTESCKGSRLLIAAGPTNNVKSITSAGGTKKGRGRPRKVATPNQSENLSSASSASTSTKGPTLTAKKDITKKVTGGTTTNGSRRRLSRQNSVNLPFPGGHSGKEHINVHNIGSMQTTATPLITAAAMPKLNTPDLATSDDSSSSTDSSTDSNTSSTTDSEEETTTKIKEQQRQPPLPSISVHSSSDENATSATSPIHKKPSIKVTAEESTKRPTKGPRRIVKQLNRRKSTIVEDMTSSTSSSSKTATGGANAMSMSSSSSSSTDSSTEDYIPSNTAVSTTTAAPTTAHHHHLTTSSNTSRLTNNRLSPYKTTTTTTTIAGSSSSSRSRKLTSCSSAFSSESSVDDDDNSDSDCVEDTTTATATNHKEKKLRRDKPKSDKNKINTLTRIFKTSNEGGAKKQGQVVIVDQSEEQLQQQQQQQKYISPALRASQENLSFSGHHTPTGQSPRLTPGSHMRSPRSIPPPQHTQPMAASGLVGSVSASTHSTSDRSASSTSSERKVQQRIKTPTRTPTRTPPTTRTPTPTLMLNTTSTNQPLPLHSPLLCKIDLSRLLRLPSEWQHNSSRIYGHTAVRTPTAVYDHESILNADLQSSTTQMRLTHSLSGGGGGSGGSTLPRSSAGGRTATSETMRSRENLQETGTTPVNSKQRLSKSPKDHLLLPPPPNGYTAKGHNVTAMHAMNSPSKGGGKQLLMSGVKHEHNIKYEPDGETYEMKFKVGSETSPLIKQELFLLKQDYKPNDLTLMTDKQRLSPPDIQVETKLKRKHTSTSSPFKEKKRKKDKELLAAGVMMAADKEKHLNATAAALRDAAAVTTKEKETTNHLYTPAKNHFVDDHSVLYTKGNAAPNPKKQPVDQQIPPTNHDRQHHYQQQQQQLMKTHSISSTASPAHLQNQTINSTSESGPDASVIMPPPANVGPLTAASKVGTIMNHNTVTSPSFQTINDGYLNMPVSQQSNVEHATCSSCLNATATVTQPPQVIYRSYFERDEDGFNEDFRNDSQYMKEAIDRKHAADRETNCFKQLTLYLEAVIYFLVSGAAMEQHSRSEEAAWTMYRDTLSLIKFISSKFRHMQVSSASQHETNNKVAILSLRCQSLITLKLYKLRRGFCRQFNQTCADYFKPPKKETGMNGNGSDSVNGRTSADMTNGRGGGSGGVVDTGPVNSNRADVENAHSSISPSNSAGSHSSGSNTPPSKIVPLDIHSALQHQHQYFNYLTNSHDLWDQADRLVRQGNHTSFFIALDHENGPLTLHSSVFEVFRYVQAGLAKLKEEMSTNPNDEKGPVQ